MEDERMDCSQELIWSCCLRITSSFLRLFFTEAARSALRPTTAASRLSILLKWEVIWFVIRSSLAMMVLTAASMAEGADGLVGLSGTVFFLFVDLVDISNRVKLHITRGHGYEKRRITAQVA